MSGRFPIIAARLKPYAMAVLLVCAAIVMSRLLAPVLAPYISPPYFLAIMFAAILGGQGPGLLATALSALATGYYDLGTSGRFELGFDDLVRLAVFTLEALVIGSVSAARKKAEEDLRTAVGELATLDRAKDEFIASISHELRTPLTGVLGWARLLKDHELDRETRRVAVESIHRAAETQAMIVNDLLDASRIVLGKLELNLEPVELAAVVEEAIATIRPVAAERSITIAATLEPRIFALADRHRFKQVVWNLLSNAVKFSDSGRQVDVTLLGESDALVLEVADDGCGIDPDLLPEIFERFRQAPGGARKGGIGIGLSIARHVVEAHGGTIEAESGGPGRGARFRVKMRRVGSAELPGIRLVPNSV